MKARIEKRIKAAEQFLDQRWEIVFRGRADNDPSPANLSYYNGACDILVQMGFYWQRKEGGKHYVGKEF